MIALLSFCKRNKSSSPHHKLWWSGDQERFCIFSRIGGGHEEKRQYKEKRLNLYCAVKSVCHKRQPSSSHKIMKSARKHSLQLINLMSVKIL